MVRPEASRTDEPSRLPCPRFDQVRVCPTDGRGEDLGCEEIDGDVRVDGARNVRTLCPVLRGVVPMLEEGAR
jgi:hypothetical protein